MSETIKLNFEIPHFYYTQEELNNCIKKSISNVLSNYTVNAYSSTQGHITIPLKNIISGADVDIEDID